MSLPYSVAAAFVFGTALPPQYADDLLRREDLRQLSAMVRVEPDPSLERGVSCDMTVTFHDGSTARSVVDHPKGSVQNPMTDQDLRAKFDSLTEGLLPEGAADSIRTAIDHLDDVEDINMLLDLVSVVGS